MQLTRQQVIDLNKALSSVGNLQGVKFAYAIARNKSLIASEVDAINKAYEPSEEYNTYDKERVELAKKHAVKLPNGKPEVVNSAYKLVDEEAFNKELEELKDTHRAAVDGFEKQLKDVQELLKEKVEITLHMIPVSYVPEEITASQMTGILPIIEDKESTAN